MKTALLTILTMTSFSGMAFAAVDKSTDVNSGTYAVERMICSKLYVAAAGNQSPTYQAGIDAQGNAVAPADISPAADNAPDYVEVPMTVDLGKRMGLNQPGVEMQMPVANLKLYKDGRVEYNGQDISSNASALCGTGKKSNAQPAVAPRTATPANANANVNVNGQQYAPHPSSNPSYVSPTAMQSRNINAPAPASVAASATMPSRAPVANPAMIESAAGQDQMLVAPSQTVNPDPRNNYQSDSVAPDQVEPQAGSVAASATNTPAPRTPLQVQRSTVNMVPRTAQ